MWSRAWRARLTVSSSARASCRRSVPLQDEWIGYESTAPSRQFQVGAAVAAVGGAGTVIVTTRSGSPPPAGRATAVAARDAASMMLDVFILSESCCRCRILVAMVSRVEFGKTGREATRRDGFNVHWTDLKLEMATDLDVAR
ncbi:hypothetical protein M0657_010085 [Pyricularia oryzae]|nr:hypothetical protein M9X92_010070 [Pyricularia oryzae]KAI7913279.1 hypothetical protein M0657_010085 [Pyricularia oryzae]